MSLVPKAKIRTHRAIANTFSKLPIWTAAYRWYRNRVTDAFLVSYPKCGRTWLRLMIGKVLVDHFHIESPGRYLLEVTPLAHFHGAIPRLEITHEGKPYLKTPNGVDRTKQRFRGQKVILLVRDPRDVIVSLYHHRCERDKFSYQGSIGQFIKEERGGFDTLIAYYNAWAASADVPQTFLMVKYEDLHRDAHGELARIFKVLGVAGIKRRTIEAAVNFAAFENMRAMEQDNALNSERLAPGSQTEPQSFKTRKGIFGGFKEELSGSEIDFLNERLEKNLSNFFGYSAQ